MLVSCCQYDYLSLPQQAKDFYKAIKPIRPDIEFLYDKPYVDAKKVRVAGPFTVESLSPRLGYRSSSAPVNFERRGPNSTSLSPRGLIVLASC